VHVDPRLGPIARLRPGGGARVAVVETFRGAGAVLWRNQLEEIPDNNMESQFESAYIANLLPGGQLTRLVISGREDPEAPLVLRYDVELASLARESRSGWVVPPIFRAQLGPQYARVASRTVSQLVAAGLALDVEVHVRVPEGTTFASVPADASLEAAHGARASVASSSSEGALALRRSFRVPRMRITPEEYPAFARFCRASDEAEAAEIRVRM